jgi:protein transport protein SEC24
MMQYIYPKLFSLHDMPDNAGVPDDSTGETILPPPMNLSSERLVSYGLYLIDDGQTQFLWVGKDAVPQLIMDVFGVSDRTMVKVGKTSLPALDNEFNERVRAVTDKSRDHRSKGVGSIVVPHLYVVREDGDPSLRLWAQTLLVEDRADQGVSLQQWMGSLREKVSPMPLTSCYVVLIFFNRSFNSLLPSSQRIEINVLSWWHLLPRRGVGSSMQHHSRSCGRDTTEAS